MATGGWSSHRVLVALLLFVATFKNDFSFFVAADFGDAVDPTFNCPAYTTCKQVCVAAVEDCPAEMQCPANETLCVDGSCATECDDPSAESPCAFDCASVACNKVDNYYDACNTLYGPWYTNETKCGETEKEETQFAWNMTEPGFVLMYVWIILLTLSIVSWCAYNQRIAPVSGAVQSLNVQNKPNEPEHAVAAWQTGYRVNVVGIFLQLWTVLTLISMHALLGWLTIQYYVNEEVFTSIPLRFEDQENLLKFFEILWMVSFVFSFMLKWPYSLKSLFLRRCELANATHVAICVYQSADDGQETFHTGYMAFLRVLLTQVQSALDKIMTVIFSDVDAYGRKKGANGIYQFCKVERDSEGSRFFVFGFRRYNLDAETGHYQPGVYTIGKSVGDMQSAGAVEGGLSNAEVESRRRVVGPNAIEMPPPNAFKIIFKEFGQPFYTYQAFMVWTWFPLWYYYMALTWTFVILIGGLTVSYFQYRNDRNLYKITHITGEISVLRDGEMVQLSPKELVPGDIVEVRPGTTYCDMVVLSTSSIMIDESALTGEATPKLKASIREAESSAADYSSEKHKRHTIWAGTLVLETDNTRAMVTQTASYTARGELIRDIYSYKRHQFKFDVEVPIVIAILFFYAIFGFSMVAYFIQDSPVYAWFYGMFVVATILPPLLPTVFTVSVGISSDRLARKQISCTNPEAILVAGKVDRALFDKTGTLTKQGLDFMDAKAHGRLDSELSLAMASCHTLSVTQTGILAGHPVDREMFEQSGAISNSTSGPLVNITDKLGQAATIVRHFDFDHHRMTQSVIVKKASDQSIVVFVKGSGENIKKICEKSSIPEEFDKALRQTAKAGVYQIAVAMKTLDPATDVSQITRDEVENSLTFVGHVDFKNVIRPETSEVIQHLHSGRVKTVMVTGDSVLTGVCIAKEAGIFTEGAQVIVGHSSDSDAVQWTDSNDHLCSLPSHDSLTDSRIELALSAQAWSTLRTSDPKQAAQLFEFIRVYGRCTPYDKISIVTAFNERGQVTLMCGDGGNDCGALKSAHVGVALSDAEASIVAPFTSLEKSITSVVDVLLEGRCSLASSLAAYKFMIMYGQIETINQLINAYLRITFSEWCWVFMDGIWTITLAFTLPLARSATTLAQTLPTASVLGPQTLSSVLGILVIHFIFLVGALSYLWHQDWFQCRKWDGQDVSNVQTIGDNYESEVLFLVTGYQYISSAMVFNFGFEWRQNWFRNYLFVAFALVYTTMQFYITLVPGYLSCVWRVNCDNESVLPSVTTGEPAPIQNSFNTTVMPPDFQRGLIGIMVGNTIAIALYEYYVVNGIRRHYAARNALVPAAESSYIDLAGADTKAEVKEQPNSAEVEA